MSIINNNIIVDGYLLVSKSATINGQLNTANIIATNDITANGNSLRTIGEYLNFPTVITNTTFGKGAFQKECTGIGNSCIGFQSMKNNFSGSYNNTIGYNAMYTNISGYHNNAIGYNSLFSNISGNLNIGIGTNSLYSNTIGFSNIGIGYESLKNNETGTTNIAIGDYSQSNIATGIKNNIAIGCSSLYKNQNNDNLAIGVSSLYNNTTGNKNIAIGNSTLLKNDSGSFNIGIGFNSLNSNITGVRNIGIGIETLNTNISGNSNIAVGYQALNANVSGDNNIAVGYQALNANVSGTNNIAIGYQANNTNTRNISTISIGSNVLPTADNQIVIGNGGYDGYINVSSLCIGKNNYTTNSNYQVVVNNTLTTTNNVFLNSNNISVGNTNTNISFVASNINISASNINISASSNVSLIASNININSSTFNISATNVGLGTTTPTGKLHIYETFGSGDISNFIWNQIGSSNPNGSINAIAVDSNGKIYVGGSFSSIGGLTLLNNIASWNSTTGWSAIGTGTTKGVNGIVYSIAIDSNNNVYVGGRFTTAGAASTGTITVNNIAKWNGSTWSAIGTQTVGVTDQTNNPENSTVYSIIIDINNNVYFGGTFSLINGAGSVNNIAYLNNTTYILSGVGSSAGNYGVVGTSVRSIILDTKNNLLYISGKFSSIYNGSGGTISSPNIASYNITTSSWSTLGSGLGSANSSTAYTLGIDSNSDIYAGGDFTTAGGSTANKIAKWTKGTNTWSAITFNSTNGTSGTVFSIVIDNLDKLYVGGNFATAGGVSVNNIAKWNGSLWTSYDYFSTKGITGSTGATPAPIYTLFLTTYYLYIGGEFTATGGNTNIQKLTYINYTNYDNDSQSKGTLVLEHGNSGGCSSIVFPSNKNKGSDYGYIMYRDNVSETNSLESGRLEIGTENDNTGINADALILQKNGGYVGIGKTSPAYVLDINGVTSATSFNATSDYRIKENIININNTSYSDFFYNLNPVYYLNKHKNRNDFGFIAHEVQKLYPDLVDGKKDDTAQIQSLNYSGLIPLCVNEIQKQKQMIKEQNNKISYLIEEITKLKN